MLLRPSRKRVALYRRVLDHAFLDKHAQCGSRDRAGERIAAEGRAVLAGLERAEHRRVGKHGRDRIEAAGQCLAEQRHVGLDAVVLLRQQLAGAAEPGLDLVEDQHHVMRGADFAHPCEIPRWRDDDAGFSLDRLDQEGDGVRRDRLPPAPWRRRRE